MPLIQALKVVFISKSKDGLEPSDWPRLFEVIADTYGLFLKISHMGASSEDVLAGKGLLRLEKLLLDAKGFMLKIVSKRENEQIALTAFDDVIDALGTQTAFKIPYRGIALKLALRPIIRRLMGGTDMGETGRAAEALTLPAIHRGFEMLEQWMESQKTLDQLYLRVGGLDTEHSQADLIRAIEEMKLASDHVERLIRMHSPMFQKNDARVSFFTRTRGDLYSYRGLSRMLWLQTQARIFFRGFAVDPRRAEQQNYLFAHEWTTIYMEFSEIAFDMGL